MHPLHEYVAKQLADKLKSKKLVVWYDARGGSRPSSLSYAVARAQVAS